MGFFSSVVKSVTNPIGYYKDIFNNYHNSTSGASQQADANNMAMLSWNLANDYNHPIQQMNRLKAAGLNPNLVYGSGSVAGNTTSAPSLVGGGISTKTESAIRGLNTVLNFAQGKATLEQTRAGTQASAAAAGASSAQAANLNQQTAINATKAQYEEKALIADIDYKQALADKTRAEAQITQGEADLLASVGGSKGAGALGSFGKTALRGAKVIFGR